MAKKTRKKTKEQSANNRLLPLSSADKKTVNNKRSPTKKTSTIKPIKNKPSKKKNTQAKKSQTKKATLQIPKSASPKKLSTTTKTKRLVSLPLWRRTKIVIAFEIKPANKKKSPASKQSTKNSKTASKKQSLLSLAIIFAGISGSVYFCFQAVSGSAIPELSHPTDSRIEKAAAPPLKAVARSAPERLIIKDIALNTTLTPLGLNNDGTIEVPKSYDIAGWYRYGPTPGERGPAVIVGHLDNVKGAGVFWRLRELSAGKIVEVSRADGKIVKFKIDGIKDYSKNNFPTQEVYGDVLRSELRLITCSGTFNRITQQYSNNTVIFATRIE